MIAFRKLRTDQILITIYSEPFHTGPYGYKMRLELHPNGRNDGLNTHLSIFVREKWIRWNFALAFWQESYNYSYWSAALSKTEAKYSYV